MKLLFKHIFFFFLFLSAVTNVCAQEEPAFAVDSIAVENWEENDPALASDSMNEAEEVVKQHRFDQEKWEKLCRELHYEQEKKQEEEVEKIRDPGWNWNINKDMVKIIMWCALGVIVVIVLILFARNKYFSPKNHKVKRENAVVSDFIPDNIDDLNLRALLENAMKADSYREAVRIYYLIVLRDLSDKNLIVLKKNSISKDFLNAMHGHAQYRKFFLLNRLFEKVWYGDYDINAEDFSAASAMFEDFINAVNSSKA